MHKFVSVTICWSETTGISQVMAQHNELGRRGEEEAVNYLKSKNYRILCRNWRFYGYEIDVVAENEEFIVFVEVKTRTSTQWGNPVSYVDMSRMRRMVDAANHYLIEMDIDKPARFDIIGLVWNGERFDLEHIDDAFLPFL
ncbi:MULTISPECIES: YraN family protein [Petrimonas]|jgi:putative endonuclease|uniref:UPF0102 protein ING2E5A_0927 n=2 Tax=Petrimonas mucosa TaxID=1642646 RepID=A0A1G4G5E9_9BACT|nr:MULTISPECIES: YraN family protein [Petrimonas]MDD3560942.1 YraN family protein [Petrimonas mucosa]SCM56537.1 UPF0102 protein [Petrimonas mucosa]